MTKRTIVGVVALVALAAGTARADMPPPPGYQEQCTVEIQQGPGQHCEACGSSHETPDGCAQHFAGTALTKRCQTYGASVWTEVWCDAAGPAPAPAASSSSCSVSPHARSPLAALLLSAAAVGLAVRRRRAAK